jgi:aspartate/methionine/tyrosine aminotransferase
VFSSICDDGDEIIVPNPCFVAYDPEIIFAGGVPSLSNAAPKTISSRWRRTFALPSPKNESDFYRISEQSDRRDFNA